MCIKTSLWRTKIVSSRTTPSRSQSSGCCTILHRKMLRQRRPVIAGAARRDRGWGRGDGASNNKPPPGPPGVDPASEEEDWDDWGDWGDPKVLSDWVDEAQAARRNGKSRSQSSRRRGR
ncbi:hypothetical protein COCSUDRAFT_55015, partial [Coccomyxa subellipsoidea C-169]